MRSDDGRSAARRLSEVLRRRATSGYGGIAPERVGARDQVAVEFVSERWPAPRRSRMLPGTHGSGKLILLWPSMNSWMSSILTIRTRRRSNAASMSSPIRSETHLSTHGLELPASTSHNDGACVLLCGPRVHSILASKFQRFYRVPRRFEEF